jgi:hypothetical protein
MAQQTAVDWLINELRKYEDGVIDFSSKISIQNHADRMHKDQIMQAYQDGYYYNEGQGYVSLGIKEQYYNETYSKQEIEKL